ncbi:hypothetical protein [Amnibacterium soli]
MTSNLDTRAASAGDRRRTRAYLAEFVPGIVAYVLLLSAALLWGGFDGTSPTRFAWALLPVLPMIWIAIAVLRHLHRLDEYQRTRTLTGLGAGFAVAMLASIALGILQSAGFELEGSGFWIYGIGMATWGVSAAVAGRR